MNIKFHGSQFSEIVGDPLGDSFHSDQTEEKRRDEAHPPSAPSKKPRPLPSSLVCWSLCPPRKQCHKMSAPLKVTSGFAPLFSFSFLHV